MKQKKKHRLPLFWKLMLWILVSLICLLSITLGVNLRHSLGSLQRKIDESLTSLVKVLAESPAVRADVRAGACSDEVAGFLSAVVRNNEDLDYITIADTDSIRLFHINPDFVGKPFEGGDQHRALAGESYLSDAGTVHFEDQRRAFHPVFDEKRQVLGFVMASATHKRINGLRGDIYGSYAKLALLLVLFTLLTSGLLAVYLGRYLRGVRPEDLLRAYLAQNDILNALDNGIISFDNAGRIRLVNAAAARMLGHREDMLMGQNVDGLLRTADGTSLRGITEGERGLQSSRPNILVKPVQLPDSNLWARQVLLLTDKTEITRYAEELVGTRHMISTLRANTHEFLNKLQVISGLLQMDRREDALRYIGAIAAIHESITAPVMKRIRNTSLAALILGKAGNMRELDIEMILMSNSSLPERSDYLSTAELVTVVGNLLENAIEATDGIPAENLRVVTLQITEDDRGLLIMVSDTGEGISRENLTRIFERGFSTKAPAGRGVGMSRVREIVNSHGGSIDVETEPGSGTTFTVIISRKRGGIP